MYFVIGGNGYLGSYIIKTILERTNEKVIATSREVSELKSTDRLYWYQCDVQKEQDMDKLVELIEEGDNSKIIYLAAYHKPDLVEKNHSLAWDINVTSLSRFVNKLGQKGKLFYVSTDCVYGESIEGYHFKETDRLNPVNFYGHTKCAAESIVIHMGYNVVRFPFLIQPSLVAKKHFYDEILENIKLGKEMQMFVDSYRSSLSFQNAAILLIDLIELEERIPSIINICGDCALSKYDVGLMIARKEGIDEKLIVPVSIKDKSTVTDNFQTKRASSTVMDNTLLKKVLHLNKIDIFDLPE